MAKLLLIDDESSYAHKVKVLLRMRGHEVSLSLEACESVALFREGDGSYDAVILDVNMPGMSGLKVLEELRAIQPTLPVILSSGEDFDTMNPPLPQLTDVLLLRKPFAVETLFNTLEAVLRLPV